MIMICKYNHIRIITAMTVSPNFDDETMLQDGWKWYQLVLPGFEEIMGVA